MNKIEQAHNFFDEINKFSEDRINNKEDIQRIIELAYDNDNLNKLEDISFSAKYTMGLYKIISSRSEVFDEEYFNRIKREFSENIEKVKSLLKELILPAGEFLGNIYKEKYFSLSQESLTNLASLCADLSYIKLYLNDLKRSKNS